MVIHYEEALYQVYGPLPLPLIGANRLGERRGLTDRFISRSLLSTVHYNGLGCTQQQVTYNIDVNNW